jgi:hypothetical protein
MPQLTGSESEKRIAIIAISSLGNTELATKIAALDRSEGSKKALEAIARNGATEEDRDLALVKPHSISKRMSFGHVPDE